MHNGSGHILRYGRIAVAACVSGLVTWMLVSYGESYPGFARWIGRVQFMPAAMAFSIATIVLWLIVTLVFGRVYCSVACPLGVWQDVCARLPRMGRVPAERRYHYSAPLTKWRNVSLACVVLAIFAGITLVTSLVDPWSIYSRACANVVKPAWGWFINIFSEPAVKIASASVFGVTVSAISMGVIGWVAFRNGRTFCNSLCPVGTTLGYVSRYSIFHIDINTDRCVQCRKCEHVCKASCIDLISHVVDASRCVECFDCLPVCDDDAIHYTWSRHKLSTPMMQKVENALSSGMRYKLDAETCMGCDPIGGNNGKNNSHEPLKEKEYKKQE